MTQNKITNMGIISIERELVSKINFKHVIDEFVKKKLEK